MSFARLFALGGLAFVLAACGDGSTDGGGGGGGDGVGDLTQSNRFCHTIPSVSSGCSPCVNTNDPAKVFDSNLATYSAMSAGGQSAYRGRSPEVQTAGSIAGAYFVLPATPAITITISTFLNGAQQEAGVPVYREGPSNSGCSGIANVCEFSGNEGFVGLETTLPFDEIHAAVSNSGADDLLVYELCVR